MLRCGTMTGVQSSVTQKAVPPGDLYWSRLKSSSATLQPRVLHDHELAGCYTVIIVMHMEHVGHKDTSLSHCHTVLLFQVGLIVVIIGHSCKHRSTCAQTQIWHSTLWQ